MDNENGLPSNPSESKWRIGFLGTFAFPALENAFRQRNFGHELWLSCFLVPAAMLRVSLFILPDYQHFGMEPPFWSLLSCRLVFLVVSAWVLLALRRAASPAAADRLFMHWALFLGALTVYALSARPPNKHELLLMSFVVVLGIYCLTSLPIARQTILALTYSGAALYVSRRVDGVTLSMVGLAYVVANVVGAATSWRLNHRRREEFLGVLHEAKLRAKLEHAVTDIRTLRGRLCICAWCKRIRGEVEAWQSVETFVQSRTHATFTHGICPACLESQASEIAACFPDGADGPGDMIVANAPPA